MTTPNGRRGALVLVKSGPAEVVEAWLSGKSQETLKNYRLDLRRFARYLGAADEAGAAGELLQRPHGEANALVFGYRKHLLAEGLTPRSVNRHLASLASMVKVARMVGLVPWTLEVPRLKAGAEYRDTRGPGRAGFLALLEKAAAQSGPKGIKDQLVLRLLYERGLRISEVLGLDLAHVEVSEARVWILGKGRTAREAVTLAPSTLEALRRWLDVRGQAPGPLVCRVARSSCLPRAVKRLSRQGGYRLVRELGEAVGIRARPHGLRHSAITDALDAGADIRAVQRFSRHRSMQTVCIYDDNRRDLGGQVAALIAVPTGVAVPRLRLPGRATVPMPPGLRRRAG